MEVPQYHEIKGIGTFRASGVTFNSDFVLLRNPYWIGVLFNIDYQSEISWYLLPNPGPWQLRGTLQDGRSVQCDSLLNTGSTEPSYNVGFSALESVRLGTSLDQAPVSSEFPLVNYFEGPISLHHRGWKLTIAPGPELQQTLSLVKKWKLPYEGMTLQCTCLGATIQDHRDMAWHIMPLASLALGTSISNHRHIFRWESDYLETWKFWTGGEKGPGPAIPPHYINTYFSVALSSFESLPAEKQELFRLGVTYITLSECGYLDSRLLTIAQAWEFLSQVWVDKPKLSEDLLCLRSRLKRTIKEWKQDHVNSDPNGFWGGRVTSALDWGRPNDQVQQFASMWRVDLEKLGVDLPRLRRIRDEVTHAGRLPRNPSATTEDRYILLRNARHALRLILLKMVGYQDVVYVGKGGFKHFVPLEEALEGEYDSI